jgi:hypothetical protein
MHMARAKRHFIPGHIWHLTHLCHRREFFLKFSKDHYRYLPWLYQAQKRYKLTILDYRDLEPCAYTGLRCREKGRHTHVNAIDGWKN